MLPLPPNKRVAASYEVFVRFPLRLENVADESSVPCYPATAPTSCGL